jgi:hypothetical protein
MITLRFFVLSTAFAGMTGLVSFCRAQERPHLGEQSGGFVLEVEPRHTVGQGDCKWKRSFRAADGTIFLPSGKKATDGGLTIVENTDPDLTDIIEKPECAVFVRPGIVFAMRSELSLASPGEYRAKAWRSSDELKTLQQEAATFEVPDGPTRNARGKDEFYGLYVFRTILQLADGTWLATLEGNMAGDTIKPTDHQSVRETTFKERTIVVSSTNEGHTWKYLSTVAYPRPDDPVGEGFVEPALVQLTDDRLLCVMRTGHHFPLYSCWSSDQGKTWTRPLYTGLERGCDPCLIRLRDGRILLSYGKRFPEGWSHAGPNDDFERFEKEYPGESLLKLAISEDGSGSAWQEVTIGRRMGTCYSCIFEVEPNVIFCQVDGWCFRVQLRPKQE